MLIAKQYHLFPREMQILIAETAGRMKSGEVGELWTRSGPALLLWIRNH